MPNQPQDQEYKPAGDGERPGAAEDGIRDLDAQDADPQGGYISITKRIDKTTPL